MSYSRKLIIFEGPDGAGKSTLASSLARSMDAHYVHCGPFLGVTTGLARLYAEAIMPAVLGHRDVILDRCWYSEKPYADAFRGGKSRLQMTDIRMLERLALRCQTSLVLCLPPFGVVMGNFLERKKQKGGEYLDSTDQLLQVFQGYEALSATTQLPLTLYDYTVDSQDLLLGRLVSDSPATPSSIPHPVSTRSAGSLIARVAIVGESFGQIKNEDPLYQWPFASFSNVGCSRWLAQQLHDGGIPERKLLWVNSDQLEWGGQDVLGGKKVITLGDQAAKICARFSHDVVGQHFHPQAWKRFKAGQAYPLISQLKEYI